MLGAKPLSEKVSRTAFLLYILFLQLASAHHLLVEPALSSEWKVFNTSYAMYLAVLGSMIHGMTVPGAIEAAQRKRGFTNGIFEWLRKAPWDNPAFAGMFLSLVMFGFLGGISGVVLGTEQINLIMHNTLYVPGHFHATVVTGTTLAFMAVTYLVIPLIFQRELVLPKVAQLAALRVRHRRRRHLSVHDGRGHARRVAPALGHHLRRGAVQLRLSGDRLPDDGPERHRGAARGDSAASCTSWWWSARSCSARGRPQASHRGQSKLIAPSGPEVAATYGSAGTWHLPGTYVLVGIFFTAFALYYFVNWKYLSEIWPMG